MRAGTMVGRGPFTAALRSAVDAADSGTGGVLLLAGEAGQGKTTLAEHAADYARHRGAAVAWGTCWEGAGAPGYWPWIQVVRALARDGDGCAAVLAALAGEDRRTGGTLGDEAAARFRVFDATAGYLRARAAAQPSILVLDDLHWADLSSLRLLSFLARQLRDTATLVVGTFRDDEVSAGEPRAGQLLAELAGQAERLQLTGLTDADVADLLAAECGQRPSGEFAALVRQRTGGNPFFVRETARLIVARGIPPSGVPALAAASTGALLTGVPPAVRDVLDRRLARLPQPVVDLLSIAAVIGKRFAVADLSAMVGQGVAETAAAADIAVAAGVLTGDGPGHARFSHDLFREVLQDSLPTTRRRSLHLTIAQSLESAPPAGAPPWPATRTELAARIARHRVLALPLGDPILAAEALVTAARLATARTAFDEAAAQLGQALDLAGGTEGASLGLLCEYGDALRRAGSGEQARAVFRVAARRARADGDTSLLTRAAFGAHRVTTVTDTSRADVIALLEAALTVLGDGTDQPAADRWLASAALARELADGPDRDRPRAADLASAAAAGARSAAAEPGRAGAEGRRALAYALFALCDVRWEPGGAAERLRLAEDLAAAAAAAGEPELLLEAHMSKLVALLELGDPAFAAALDAFTRLAEQAAIPRFRYLARSRRATLATLTGPFELADKLITAAAEYGERTGEPDTWGVRASQLAGLAMLRHDWTRISALAAARGQPLTPPEFAVHERAWVLVEAGDRAAAAALVTGLPERPATYRWRHAALLAADADLAAAVGDLPRCAALYAQLLPLNGQFAVVAAAVFSTGPVALQLGLLAAALGRPDEAERHLTDAVASCEHLGARLHADRARAELARITRQRPGSAALEFRREGDVWTLTYAGRTVRMRDAKGLRDLAVLLTVPGREVAAADLLAGLTSPDTRAADTAAASAAAGTWPATASAPGADPVLDDRARAAYRARLTVLDSELAAADERADADRSARLSAERDALISELAGATGLGGRPRRLGDAAERARSTVTARIRDAVGRVEQVHPQLGRHLRDSVVTGTRCAYRPAQTMRWQVTQA